MSKVSRRVRKAKRRGRPETPDKIGGIDVGTDERAHQRGGIRIVDRTITAGGVVVGVGAVSIGENQLDLLIHTNRIGGTAEDRRAWRAAGNCMMKWFHQARLAQRLSGNYQQSTSREHREVTDKEAEAMRKYIALFKPEALGWGAANLLENVICFDMDPPASLLPKFEIAIDALAKHLRFKR